MSSTERFGNSSEMDGGNNESSALENSNYDETLKNNVILKRHIDAGAFGPVDKTSLRLTEMTQAIYRCRILI